jgi:putative ABC transport system permease protein
MTNLLQDLRFGLRTLRKTPGFTAVALAVLALGIGANTAMFTLVNAMMFRSLGGRADELVGLYSHDRTIPNSYRAFSYPTYADIRDHNDVFENLLAHNFAMVGLPAGDTMRQTFVAVVSSNYFDTLGVHLAAGRPFTPEEERPGSRIPVVIVGQNRAALLGGTLKINAIDFTVIGVAPPGFAGTMALAGPEVWLPLGMYELVVNDVFKSKTTGLQDRSNPSLILAGRLKPGVTPAVAAARLEALSRQLESAYPAENKNQLLTSSRLPRMSTSTAPSTDQGLGTAAALLMGLAAVVLLIACLNLANMLLARGTARRRELAVRLAIGGTRQRIVRQLLTEGLLLATGGAAGGLLLSFLGIQAFMRSLDAILPVTLQFDPRPDATVLIATTLFAMVATVLFGMGPAFRLSRVDLISSLKEHTGGESDVLRRWFSGRNVLVVGQIALSLMLLSAGGLFAHGAIRAASADPGFSYRQQLLVSIDPSLVQYDETHGRTVRGAAVERLRALPGVASVGMASTVPFGAFHEGRQVVRVGSRPDPNGGRSNTLRIIGAEYFRTLGLPMVRGREFTRAEEESPDAPRVVVIDQALARQLFHEDDPLGQMIRFLPRADQSHDIDTTPMQVVGIAAPIRDILFQREAPPTIYIPSGRNYRALMNLHVRGADGVSAASLLPAIRQALRDADPRLPVLQTTTLQAFHDESIALWAVRSGGRMFLLFGLIALGLAVVGLYGVKSYLVSRRTREIGIRVALGARPADVLGMVLKEGAVVAGVGVAIGLPLAALLGMALSSLLYEVKPLDPVVFTTAPAVLAAAAMVATWLPARRATRVTPLTALRDQ